MNASEKMTRFCSDCGGQNRWDSNYCDNCGNTIRVECSSCCQHLDTPDFESYQRRAEHTAEGVAVPDASSGTEHQFKELYLALAINGEAGELGEKIKKAVRTDDDEEALDYIKGAYKEIGDILWYCAMLAELEGWSLGEIAADNLDKLEDRQERDVLHDEGDER